MQFAIYLDPKQPEVVVEAYTFSFSYKEEGGGERSPVGFNVKDTRGNEITVVDASKNLQQVVRSLIVITQSLQPLPGKL